MKLLVLVFRRVSRKWRLERKREKRSSRFLRFFSVYSRVFFKFISRSNCCEGNMGDQSPRPRLHISFFHPIRLCCMPSWRDACTGDSSSEMEESFCTRPPATFSDSNCAQFIDPLRNESQMKFHSILCRALYAVHLTAAPA